MLKVFSYLTKRADLETQAFIDYYENHHVPLVLSLASTPTVYKRNYLVRGDEFNREEDTIDFDVVTELVFSERAGFLEWVEKLSVDAIATDEEKFLRPGREPGPTSSRSTRQPAEIRATRRRGYLSGPYGSRCTQCSHWGGHIDSRRALARHGASGSARTSAKGSSLRSSTTRCCEGYGTRRSSTGDEERCQWVGPPRCPPAGVKLDNNLLFSSPDVIGRSLGQCSGLQAHSWNSNSAKSV